MLPIEISYLTGKRSSAVQEMVIPEEAITMISCPVKKGIDGMDAGRCSFETALR
jgi:hypothetical protein